MYGQTHSRTRSKDRQRGRGSRQRPEGMRLSQQLRTPIVVFLVCLVTFFYNLDHISAPIRHPRASAPIPPSKVLMTRLRRLSNPRPSSPRLAFAPSSNPIPVHHDLVEIDFDNHPVADSRPPSHQFTLDRSIRKMPPPVIAIITCTHDPRDVFEDTAKALFGQSLQNFIWVIVDDHTSSQASLTLLKTVSKDPRVTILHNKPGVTGLPAGRNVALSHILALKNIPPYLASLDDDDLFELTALEKVTWMLESNPQWAIGGFRYIKFGAANESVTTGLHSGFTNWQEGNFVPNAAVYRSSAVLSTGCRYDEVDFKDGGEDWDFWMCFADHGLWGGTIPEPLFWYRVNTPKFRASRWGDTFEGTWKGFHALRAHIQKKHSTLALAAEFPNHRPKASVHLEPVVWTPPFPSLLAKHDKSIMFILPWLYLGGADIGALHMIQIYAEAGYRVTVVCTIYKLPEGLELRPWVLQWTHDVHVIPSFLRGSEFPRYIKHLVESRGMDKVIISNSQLAYEMLPALSEQLPRVQFIDYLHNEAYDGWKSGGYPTYSIISQRYLARTITCSSYLRQWLIDRGHTPHRIGVVKLGIAIEDFNPATLEERNAAKMSLLNVQPTTIVITIVARLDPQKRPMMVPRIVTSMLEKQAVDFIIVMVGDGDLGPSLSQEIGRLDVNEFVSLEGTSSFPRDYLVASDIFLLPSLSEGISIAVAEAMAMGLPVVTALAGALPEQLGYDATNVGAPLAGLLVNHTLVDGADAELYADALLSLINDPELRSKLGKRGRANVERTFQWRETLGELWGEVERGRNLKWEEGEGKGLPNPSTYYSLQGLQTEHPDLDFARQYQQDY